MCGQCTAVRPKEAVSISGYDDKQINKEENIRLNPDDVLEVIRFRRSIRQFKQERVHREIIEQILEAGRLTHTAKNMHRMYLLLLLDQEKDRIKQIAVGLFKKMKPFADLFSPMAKNNKITDHFFFFNAPSVIVIWQGIKQTVFLLHRIWNL